MGYDRIDYELFKTDSEWERLKAALNTPKQEEVMWKRHPGSSPDIHAMHLSIAKLIRKYKA